MVNSSSPPQRPTPAGAPTRSARPVGPGRRDPGAELDLLKALGDNTRYAIYLELARSPSPQTTAEVASALSLHPNTVRPHLERMREVGLLDVDTGTRGGVGRPQHRYSLSPHAPSLGLEPSPWPTIARVLLEAASSGGLSGDDLREAGADQGRHDARTHWVGHDDTLSALGREQSRLGFDPEVVADDERATMAFANCPFRELAEQNPELVCGLHCGMVEGFVTELGGHRVEQFHPLADRTPCRVELIAT
jgi:predicted ArsR family transcriptional regulator